MFLLRVSEKFLHFALEVLFPGHIYGGNKHGACSSIMLIGNTYSSNIITVILLHVICIVGEAPASDTATKFGTTIRYYVFSCV